MGDSYEEVKLLKNTGNCYDYCTEDGRFEIRRQTETYRGRDGKYKTRTIYYEVREWYNNKLHTHTFYNLKGVKKLIADKYAEEKGE